jgi:tRNA U55 pseudouridine synthase TruB
MPNDLRLAIEVDDNGSLKIKGFAQALERAGGHSDAARGKLHGFGNAADTVGNKLKSILGILSGLGISFGLLKIGRAVADWMKLSAAQDQAERSLKAAMVSNDRYSTALYRATLRQADAVQRLTGLDDQEILRGQKMLLLYKAISDDIMPRATMAMADMAALMGGDMKSAATQLGRAMGGSTESLRRVGIIIDENVYKQRGAIGVLEEIEKKVSGQAEALAQGSGKWRLLGAAIGEAKEAAGGLFNLFAENTGAIGGMTKFFNALADAVKNYSSEIASALSISAKIGASLISPVYGAGIVYSSAVGYVNQKIAERSARVASYGGSWEEDEEKKYTPWPRPLTHDQMQAMDETKKWLSDLTTSDYEKGLEIINAKYERLGELLGDNADLTRAYRLEVDRLKTTESQKMEGLNDIIAKNTLDSYQLKVYDLDKRFASLDVTLRNSTAGARAYALALGSIKTEEYRENMEAVEKISAKLVATNNRLVAAEKAKENAAVKVEVKRISELIIAADEAEKEVLKKWKKMSTDIGKSFTDAMLDSINGVENAFENFGKNIKNMFLKIWLDKAITQPIIMPIINDAAGMFGFSGTGINGTTSGFSSFMGSSAFGMTGGATYGQLLGAGAVGYGMGGGGTSGLITGLGAAAGMALGGPLGSMVGGFAGNYLAKMFEDEPNPPKIDLLYDIIDGKVELIGEAWKNSPRSQELIDQIQATIQGQIDLFKSIGLITGQVFQSGQIALSGRGAGGILQGVAAYTSADLAQLYASSFDGSGQALGEAVFAEFNEQFEKAWSVSGGFSSLTWENLGKKVPSLVSRFGGTSGPEMLAQLQAGNSENFETWLQTGMGFMRGTEYGKFWTPSGNAATMAQFDKLLAQLQDKITAISDTMAGGIGNAFLSALDSGAFETFGTSLRQSTYESIRQGIMQGLVAQIMTGEGSPLATGLTNILGATNQYAAGDITFQQAQGMIDQSIGGMSDAIAKMEPIMQPVYEWLQNLSGALGVNTDAITGNTDAILGPVQAFLSQMDTSLAPSQSLAGIQRIYDQKLAAAIANPMSFSDFAGYASQYLETQKGIGDYQSAWSGVRGQVENIPWYLSGASATSSAAEVGASVGQNLAPALLDLKETLEKPKEIKITMTTLGSMITMIGQELLADKDFVAGVKEV